MAFGGGTWLTQNKVLPGTYINFTSVSRASATLSDRGVVALPLPLGWGPEDEVFEVTSGDFQRDSLNILGYPFSAPEMLPLRELYRNAKTAFLYRLTGPTTKAACTVSGAAFATAAFGGSRGNALKLVIAANVDNPGAFDVLTYLDGTRVGAQIGVVAPVDLQNNAFCTFNTGATLEATAGAPFTGGTDGVMSGTAYQDALDKLEPFAFNTLGCVAVDDTTKGLYVQYTKRMRDELGAKFQLVGYRIPAADFEGVISVENAVANPPKNVPGLSEQGLVYFTLGMQAGCEVNRSCTNRRYDGELTVDANYTQKQLEDGITAGKFMYHMAGGAARVLDDINALVTLSDTKSEIFQSNQTIRVCDQIANDAAVLFNTRYIGVVPNDASGRMSLWNDICKLIQELERLRAVEDFDTKALTLEQGDNKKAVLATLNGLNIVNAMAQLYMAIVIQ